MILSSQGFTLLFFLAVDYHPQGMVVTLAFESASGSGSTESGSTESGSADLALSDPAPPPHSLLGRRCTTVEIEDDSILERSENFSVILDPGSPPYDIMAINVAVVHIIDNDGEPQYFHSLLTYT